MKKKLINDSLWTTLSSIIVNISQVIKLVILAKLLSPEDFGIYAIVGLVLSLSISLSDAGFNIIILSEKELDSLKFSTIYWFQLVLFLIVYVLVSISSPYISNYYHNSDLIPLISISMIDIVLQGIGRPYETILLKNGQLQILAIRNIIASVFSLIVALILAMQNFGVWALVFSTLVSSTVISLLNFYNGSNSVKVKFIFSWKYCRNTIKTGVFKTGVNFFDFISGKFDLFMVSRFFDISQLGQFNLAKDLVFKILGITHAVSSKVSTSIYSSLLNNIQGAGQKYLKIITIVAYVNIPLLVIVIIFRDILISVIFPNSYNQISHFLILFCLVGMTHSLLSQFGSLLNVFGKVKEDFIWSLLRMIFISTLSLLIVGFQKIELYVLVFFFTNILGILYFERLVLRKIFSVKANDFYNSFIVILSLGLAAAVASLCKFDFGTMGTYFYKIFILILFFSLILILDRKNTLRLKSILK